MTMTAADVRKRQEAAEKRGSNVPWLKIQAGDDFLGRIGPPWKKEGEIWKDVFTHGNYPDNVFCAANDVDDRGKARPCLVCQKIEELSSDRSTYGKKLWGLIHQRAQGLWNVAKVKRHTKENGEYIVEKYVDSQFKVMKLSGQWHDLLLEIFADDDLREKSIFGIADPKYGRLIKIKRTGKGRDDTKYTFMAVTKETPIFNDRDKRKKMEATVINLDKLVYGSSDEQLTAFLHKAKKDAKRLAKEEEKSAKESASASKSSSSSSKGSSSASKGSSSASGSASDKDNLEDKYKQMKERKHGSKSKSSSGSASQSAS